VCSRALGGRRAACRKARLRRRNARRYLHLQDELRRYDHVISSVNCHTFSGENNLSDSDMCSPLSAPRVTGLWREISTKGGIDVFKAGATTSTTLGKFSKIICKPPSGWYKDMEGDEENQESEDDSEDTNDEGLEIGFVSGEGIGIEDDDENGNEKVAKIVRIKKVRMREVMGIVKMEVRISTSVIVGWELWICLVGDLLRPVAILALLFGH
jgi:hypothetical protein